MPKFLVDESSGRGLCAFLLIKGFDANFAFDVKPGASDEEILKFAENENRVLITNDKDFGQLVFRLLRPTSGVILLRLRDESQKNKQKCILHLLNNFYEKIESRFVVVTEGKIRIREIKYSESRK